MRRNVITSKFVEFLLVLLSDSKWLWSLKPVSTFKCQFLSVSTFIFFSTFLMHFEYDETTSHKKSMHKGPLTRKAHCLDKNLTNVLNEIFSTYFFFRFGFFHSHSNLYNYKVSRFYVQIKKARRTTKKTGDRRDSALRHGE